MTRYDATSPEAKVDGAIDLQTGLFYGRNGLDQDDWGGWKLLTQKLGAKWGQPVVVDAKPGASGIRAKPGAGCASGLIGTPWT